MDKPIEVGNLVIVVKGMPCCGYNKDLGHVFKVAWKGFADGDCGHCGDESPGWAVDDKAEGEDCIPVECLKRIDPPAEGETEGAYVGLKEPVCVR